MPTTFLQNTRMALHADSKSISWRASLFFLAVQTLSLVAFLFFAFTNNHSYLFHGLDGAYMLTIAKQQNIWVSASLGLTNNFFQSLGNIWFPLNTSLEPEYVFSRLFNGGEVDPVISYTIFSVELFVAAFIFCIYLQRTWFMSALAAWGLVLLVMPIFGHAPVYYIFELVPHGATAIALVPLALVLFGLIGRRSHKWSVASMLGILTIIFFLGVTQPTILILVFPALSIFGISLSFGSGTTRERNIKLAFGAALIMISYFSGLGPFLSGLAKYTAAFYYSPEFLSDRQSMKFASIAFHPAEYSIAGPILFCLGTSGALLTLLAGTGKARAIAFGMIFYVTLLLSAGAAASYTDWWHGPSPLYFEFFLWPFYVIFSTVFINYIFSFAINTLRGNFNPTSASHSRLGNQRILIAKCLGLACAPWLFFVAGPPNPEFIDYHYPPQSPAIIGYLENEIGLQPGDQFRGRVATLLGGQLSRGINWFDQYGIARQLDAALGNDLQAIGLWYFNIPTLFEYSSNITPPFYLLSRTLLAKPADSQMRSVIVLSQANSRILRLLGVRFIISDAPLGEGAHLRQSLQAGDHMVYLNEIDDVNVGNYSPTTYSVSNDALESMKELTKVSFNPRRVMLLSAHLQTDKLEEATSSRMIVERGEISISAASNSHSVLVLPLEFSHCLTISSKNTAGDTQPKLFRANLLQTGILFEKRLDASITYFTGPFRNADCRLTDARDMEDLNIQRTVNSRIKNN